MVDAYLYLGMVDAYQVSSMIVVSCYDVEEIQYVLQKQNVDNRYGNYFYRVCSVFGVGWNG